MQHFTVKQYESENYQIWNTFVSQAKNATFLFHRDFMEYHSDRFLDFSLMVYDLNENLVAILPANRVEDVVYSHEGLTYGGLVLQEKAKLSTTLAVFKAVLKFLYTNQVNSFKLKAFPKIYADFLSDELDYCMFITKALIFRSDSHSVLDLSKPYRITKTRKESIRRGIKNDLIIKEEVNFELFWNAILIPNLAKKHQVKPVHSVAEITKLHQLFPKSIRHFNVYHKNKIVAGTTVFVKNNVAHPQYISGNEDKNELGSLDFLYHYLITTIFKDKKYFNFGKSNENDGQKMNQGLLFWKESFGAKTVVQHFYEVQTKNYSIIDTVLL